MVFKTESSPYQNTNHAPKSSDQSPNSSMAVLLTEFFSKIDGSPTSFEDGVGETFSMLFHPDFRFDLGFKVLEYEAAIEELKLFCSSGGVADIQTPVTYNEGTHTLSCEVTYKIPGCDGHSCGRSFHLKDGKIILGEVDRKDVESIEMLVNELSKERECKEVATLLTECFNRVDGSPSSFEDGLGELFSELVHPDYEFDMGFRVLKYQECREELESFCRRGGVAKIEGPVLRNAVAGTISTTIGYKLPGADDGFSHSFGRTYFVKDGHLFRGEVDSKDANRWENLSNESTCRRYFDAIDGSVDCTEKVLALFSKLFHPELQFQISSDESLSFGDLKALVSKFCESGGIANIEKLAVNQDGTLTVIINNLFKGSGDDRSEQRYYFRQGKIWRVVISPVNADSFSALVSRVGRMDSQDILSKFRAFIECFDGSPGASVKALPMLEGLFDPSLKVYTSLDQDPKDMEWFKTVFIPSFDNDGNVAKIESLDLNGSEVYTVIRNVVKGQDTGASAQRGLVSNGRIIRWEPVPGEEVVFQAMVDRVLE